MVDNRDHPLAAGRGNAIPSPRGGARVGGMRGVAAIAEEADAADLLVTEMTDVSASAMRPIGEQASDLEAGQ